MAHEANLLTAHTGLFISAICRARRHGNQHVRFPKRISFLPKLLTTEAYFPTTNCECALAFGRDASERRIVLNYPAPRFWGRSHAQVPTGSHGARCPSTAQTPRTRTTTRSSAPGSAAVSRRCV